MKKKLKKSGKKPEPFKNFVCSFHYVAFRDEKEINSVQKFFFFLFFFKEKVLRLFKKQCEKREKTKKY